MPKRKKHGNRAPRFAHPRIPRPFMAEHPDGAHWRVTDPPLAMWAIGSGAIDDSTARVVLAIFIEQTRLDVGHYAEILASGADLDTFGPADLDVIIEGCREFVRAGGLTADGWAPGFLELMRRSS